MKKFLIGSQYFFSCYQDFSSKDIDELEIVENEILESPLQQITGKGKCLFRLQKQDSADKYIDFALWAGLGMAIGKFLIPEFMMEIGATIEDLKRLSPLLAFLDSKHQYEFIIFKSYLINGSFTLTEEQRALAYESYKKSRQLS